MMRQFGVTLEIPAYYYYNAKFVPHMKDHLVTMAFHILPKNDGRKKVKTIFNDGTTEVKTFQEIYGDTGRDTILTLQKADGRNGFSLLQKIVLKDLNKPMMQFSKSGKYLALFKRTCSKDKSYLLEIYDSTDMTQCFQDIEAQKPLKGIELSLEMIYGIPKIVKFDIHEKLIAVASKAKMVIISLEEERMGRVYSEFKLDAEKHDTILDLVLDSSKGNNFECHIAAKCSTIT